MARPKLACPLSRPSFSSNTLRSRFVSLPCVLSLLRLLRSATRSRLPGVPRSRRKRRTFASRSERRSPRAATRLPVLNLGGGEIEPPPPNADEADGLEKLWEFIESASPLDTSQLQPFEGADVKWQKMIDARDEAEAKAKAALIYVAVLLKLGMLLATLFWRHAMLPSWMSFSC